MDDVLAEQTTPLYTGKLGKVWAYDVEAVAKRQHGGPPPELTVAAYVIEAAYAHPMWHSYLLACISLREHPNSPNTKIYLPGATHELFLMALNPDHPVKLNDAPRFLAPLNFAAQFVSASDEAAQLRMFATAKDVADGVLNPDTDYTQHWIARFGASNIKGKPETAGETRITTTAPDGTTTELVVPPVPFNGHIKPAADDEPDAQQQTNSGGGGDFGGGGATASWDSSSSSSSYDSGSSDSSSSSDSGSSSSSSSSD